MMLSEERQAKGRQRFLDAHPDIKLKIDAISEAEANALGIDVAGLRELETMKAIRDYAHSNGIDSAELFFSLVSDTAEEFDQLKTAQDAAIQRAIGN